MTTRLLPTPPLAAGTRQRRGGAARTIRALAAVGAALVLGAMAAAAAGDVQPPVPTADAGPTAWTPERAAAVDAYVRDAFARAGLPALAVAVVTPDGVVFERTLGTTALRDGRPVTPDVAFEIGSLTKSMTALVLLQLAEEGLVDLAEPVRRYLPWFRVADEEASRSITLERLLTHTSGLQPHGHGVVWRDVGRIEGSVTEAVRALATEPVDAARRPAYANTNYVVAGAVIEAVTGRPWDRVLEERILVPLGMASSAAGSRGRSDLEVVTGHARTFGLLPYATRPSAPFAGPAGSVSVATVGDFGAYLRAWLVPGATAVVTEGIAAEALEPRVAVGGEQAYGLGWRSTLRDGRRIAHHPAGTEGGGAFMAMAAEAGVGVVVFTNVASSLPGAIGFGVLDLALGAAATPPGRDAVADLGMALAALAVAAAALLGVLVVRVGRAFGGSAPRRGTALHVGRSLAAAAVAGGMWWLVPTATRAMGMPLPFGIRGFALDMLVTTVLLIAVPTLWALYGAARLVHDRVRSRSPGRSRPGAAMERPPARAAAG